MSWIEVDHVSVEFPIITGRSISLKSRLAAAAIGFRKAAVRAPVINALDKVSFSLRQGDRLGIIGLNGSGKSTLLRALAGIYEPTTGEIRVCGRVNALLDLSMGFDLEATGRENIVLRAYAVGMSAGDLRACLSDIEEFSGLKDRLHDPIRTYSAGMVLRLAFSTSLFCAHDILLIDEIIGVGDASFLAKAQDKLLSTINIARIVVVASHALNLVRNICNKAIILENGKLVASGPVDEILGRYQKDVPTR